MPRPTFPKFRIQLILLICLVFSSATFAQLDLGLGTRVPIPTKRATVSAALNVTALQPGQQAAIAVVLDIKPGFHAQSHTPLSKNLIKLEVQPEANPNITFYDPVYPPEKLLDLAVLGKVSVYEGQTIVFIPFQLKPDAAPGPIKLSGTIRYQICDDRQCFAPERPTWSIESQIVPANQKVDAANANFFTSFDPRVFAKSAKPSFSPVLFLSAFLIGIIFNVMPCVLPVVPLKIMGFYEASRHSRTKSIVLGAVFSLGIITTFAILALLVLVYRKLEWGQLFGNTYFTLGVIVVLLIMALQTFGAFEVILPNAVYQYTPSHETIVGNYFFGIFTAILSTPCTFGMFLSLLISAAAQPGFIGVALLMDVGFGMAAPYLILSAFPSVAKNLPRTGPWAEMIKQLMGFLLIGVAAFFARRFLGTTLSGHYFWWILFAIIASAALFIMIRTFTLTKRLLPRAASTALAAVLLIGSLLITLRLTYVPIDWQPYSQELVDSARSSNRPILIDFTAVWCLNCQTVESTVFTDPKIVALLKEKNVLPIRADLTDDHAPGWQLLKTLYPVGAIPLTAVYTSATSEPTKLAGIYSSQDLMETLVEKK